MKDETVKDFYRIMHRKMRDAEGEAFNAVMYISNFSPRKEGCPSCEDDYSWPAGVFDTLNHATEYAKNAINDLVVMKDTMERLRIQFWELNDKEFIASLENKPVSQDTGDQDPVDDLTYEEMGYPPIGEELAEGSWANDSDLFPTTKEEVIDSAKEIIDAALASMAGINYYSVDRDPTGKTDLVVNTVLMSTADKIKVNLDLDKVYKESDPEGVEVTPMNIVTNIPVPPKPISAGEAVKRYNDLVDSIHNKNKTIRDLLCDPDGEFRYRDQATLVIGDETLKIPLGPCEECDVSGEVFKSDFLLKQEETVGVKEWDKDLTMTAVEPISPVVAKIAHGDPVSIFPDLDTLDEYDELAKAEKEAAIKAETDRIYNEILSKHRSTEPAS